jgi:hypothetical protein
MAITIPGTYVYPMVKEWKFEITEQGCTGLRKYIDEDPSYVTAPVQLPSIGDPWDDSWPNCRVARIEIEYLGDNDNCPQIYTCHYETIFIDTQALENDGKTRPIGDELVIGLETSSELISVNPPTDTTSTTGFTWELDGDKVTQPIYFTVNTTTVKMQRMVVDLNALINASWACIGKINNDVFLGASAGTLLYTGFTSTPLRSETDRIKWKCELTFVHRTVTGDETPFMDGWNYIIREERANVADAWWQKPKRLTGSTVNYLYESAGFNDPANDLTTAGQEEKDPITSGMLPLE